MSNFIVGDIVTIKSHPLFSNTHKKINALTSLVPPLMVVKEVLFDKEEKKILYSNEIKKAKIADLTKYVCVYFNANKSEFVEKTIYHSLVKGYLDLKYYRKEEKSKSSNIDLVLEVAKYKHNVDYEFGKCVQFKTKKLEHRKSYDANTVERIPGISFQTPDFILTGIKNEEQKDLFFNDGTQKKQMSTQLFKVMWFNHYQQKFSEDYLPKEFFVEDLEI